MKLIYKAIIAISIFIGSNNNSIAQVRELSLKEAYAIALKGNRQLLISRIEELKANAIVTETRSLLSPNVSATGNYSLYAEQPVIFLRNENSAKVVQETRVGGRNNFSAAILASYPILNPLAKSKVRAAGINERLQSRKTEEIESDIAFEIGQQYLITLLYKEQLSLLNQSLERNERALKDSRSLFLQGKSLKTDTLQNFIAVQNLNASISALENRIKVQVLQLKQLLALDEHEHVMLSDSLHLEVNYALLQGEESLEKVALENRND